MSQELGGYNTSRAVRSTSKKSTISPTLVPSISKMESESFSPARILSPTNCRMNKVVIKQELHPLFPSYTLLLVRIWNTNTQVATNFNLCIPSQFWQVYWSKAVFSCHGMWTFRLQYVHCNHRLSPAVRFEGSIYCTFQIGVALTIEINRRPPRTCIISCAVTSMDSVSTGMGINVWIKWFEQIGSMLTARRIKPKSSWRITWWDFCNASILPLTSH